MNELIGGVKTISSREVTDVTDVCKFHGENIIIELMK